MRCLVEALEVRDIVRLETVFHHDACNESYRASCGPEVRKMSNQTSLQPQDLLRSPVPHCSLCRDLRPCSSSPLHQTPTLGAISHGSHVTPLLPACAA